MPWKPIPRKTKVKCPYCGRTLVQGEVSTRNPRESFFECPNYDCESSSGMCGTEDLWAALYAVEKLLKERKEDAAKTIHKQTNRKENCAKDNRSSRRG